MPVLHSYENKPGFYVRSQVDGNPITFQVSPAGAEVLEDLGYCNQSDIPWNVLRPLYNKDDLYTKNTGIDESQMGTQQEIDLSQLNQKQRVRFEAYLNEETSSVPIREIKRDVQEVLGLSLLVLAKREMESLTVSSVLAHSLKYFAAIPYTAQSIKTPTDHDIIYEFEVDETVFQYTDSRWRDDSRYDFKITCETPNEEKQIIHIRDGFLTRLYIDGKQRQSGENIEQRHKSIYEKSNALQKIRELFFHLPHYDIRPDPEDLGHGDLQSGFQLVGKHIWVTPQKYTGSRTENKKKIVGSEFKDILVRSDCWDPILVEVTEETSFPNAVLGEQVEQKP
ncbi:hypothetical protein [Natranaeroarchaeum sulfidigenes]|uniref:Uncharacterized protein n=1 Tax=Natranaeroarchaeum sulfidigenes TaxID=2784880 RepID=A0A897MS79_9EURY|nr:hypothetical protein [Natranaeroarchaeum sulfidigenes]QSG02888.1 hypothetical protein AArcS_1678 [Natranaeroarchaeum sulfidigenes]